MLFLPPFFQIFVKEFSNKTDFNLLMTNDQSVVAFGDADYEYMDFSRIYVAQKEVFVYTNGRLLMRKEVE